MGQGFPHLAVADSLCAVVHGTVVPHLAVADSLCGVVQVWDPCPMYNCTKAISYPMADNMSHLAISSGIAFILVLITLLDFSDTQRRCIISVSI